MFSALLFAPDATAARHIEQVARESGQACVYKTMHVFPSAYELIRLLNCFEPDLVLVEFSPFSEALVLARSIRAISPGTALVGFGIDCDSEQLDRAGRAGITEVISSPLTQQKFDQALHHAIRKARPAVQDNLIAFLPAKAGSGATTIAMNVAGCLANDLGQKVLVMETDLRSGLISVLLKCSSDYSILHALDNAETLDGTLWSRIVARGHGLDLLLSPRAKDSTVVSWVNYDGLMQFAKPRYDSIIVDLPEVVNEGTVEVVQRARHVFVVTTAELPSLVLARQRRQELIERGIPADRVGIILNRWTKNEIKVEQIEEFLDAPVHAVVPNDYSCIRRATQEGRLIGKKSGLGRTFSSMALNLAGPRPALPPQPKSSVPVREALVYR